ncbi:hypothetical protein [Nocardia nova]|uniref:hypothetical protein n=1 Tax=Nocardia nova TaxID=37330 RepID=UPI001893E384|nr:hypothetical protein [Nocardia nova]MBF6277051.1 hypothetical protein [Nocardia nova]
MTAAWTVDQRHLLRLVHRKIGPCIANPEWGIDYLRGDSAGGGPTYSYRFGQTAVNGEWHESIEDAWRSDGRPWRWRRGKQLGEARISYKRLQGWCESLPADVRERAVTYWRTYPVETRDLPRLYALTLAAIDADDPEPPLFHLH